MNKAGGFGPATWLWCGQEMIRRGQEDGRNERVAQLLGLSSHWILATQPQLEHCNRIAKHFHEHGNMVARSEL
jgi:hypothetical protein